MHPRSGTPASAPEPPNRLKIAAQPFFTDDALRCEKTAQNFAAFVALVCAFILAKSVHTA
jgi:hypothetical protein